jgi:hypothetical protein
MNMLCLLSSENHFNLEDPNISNFFDNYKDEEKIKEEIMNQIGLEDETNSNTTCSCSKKNCEFASSCDDCKDQYITVHFRDFYNINLNKVEKELKIPRGRLGPAWKKLVKLHFQYKEIPQELVKMFSKWPNINFKVLVERKRNIEINEALLPRHKVNIYSYEEKKGIEMMLAVYQYLGDIPVNIRLK